jgi:hypothetical protein
MIIGDNSARVSRVMMIDEVRMSAHLLVQENERVKVRLREGTFLEGWRKELLSMPPSRMIKPSCQSERGASDELSSGSIRID